MSAVGRGLREFDEVFDRNRALPIVGGQAVNLWAEAYHARESAEPVEVRPGSVYRLAAPPRLLKAKLANVHDLTRADRPQDLRHVKMLVLIGGHYLPDMHASVLAGNTAECSLINALSELNDLLRSSVARAVAEKHLIDFTPALPLDLPSERMPKLAAFYSGRRRRKPSRQS